jgi:hypothetical protein
MCICRETTFTSAYENPPVPPFTKGGRPIERFRKGRPRGVSPKLIADRYFLMTWMVFLARRSFSSSAREHSLSVSYTGIYSKSLRHAQKLDVRQRSTVEGTGRTKHARKPTFDNFRGDRPCNRFTDSAEVSISVRSFIGNSALLESRAVRPAYLKSFTLYPLVHQGWLA